MLNFYKFIGHVLHWRIVNCERGCLQPTLPYHLWKLLQRSRSLCTAGGGPWRRLRTESGFRGGHPSATLAAGGASWLISAAAERSINHESDCLAENAEMQTLSLLLTPLISLILVFRVTVYAPQAWPRGIGA